MGTLTAQRNAIGAHSGSYSLYRALAVAAGTLDPVHVPDLTNTAPATSIGPHRKWSDPSAIVSLDPYGHLVSEVFAEQLAEGWDIRPHHRGHTSPCEHARISGCDRGGAGLQPDGAVLTENGDVRVTKAAIEPVWYLPGIAERFGIAESESCAAACSSSPGACSPNW